MAVSSVNGGAIPLSPNAIINGAFDIWQRGGGTFSANGVTADRWNLGKGGSSTIAITRESFTPGAAPVAGVESAFFLRFARSSWNANDFFGTRLEDVRTYAGQTVTLSFYAKASSAFTIDALNLAQNFGSGGSSTVFLSLGTQAITTSWQRYTKTVTLPSLTGKTIGSSSYLEFFMQFGSTAANATLDIWGVQLEAGTVATPFRRNANSLAGELAACQRYYQRLSGWNGFGEGTTAIAAVANYLVELRVPALTISAVPGSTLSWRTNSATDATSTTFTLTAPTSSTQGLWLLFTNLTGIIDNQAYHSRLLNIPNEKVIEVSAEL
jgi:hypothetical protein